MPKGKTPAPAWLSAFPVLAMHKPHVVQRKDALGWFIAAESHVKVLGGTIRVTAHGIVCGFDEPAVSESDHGEVLVTHMITNPAGMFAPTGGVSIPCPSMEEALELMGYIVANASESREAR